MLDHYLSTKVTYVYAADFGKNLEKFKFIALINCKNYYSNHFIQSEKKNVIRDDWVQILKRSKSLFW